MADKTGSVYIQMKELLDEYDADLNELVVKAAEHSAKETVKDLRDSSAELFGNGRYSKGWTVKKDQGGFIVHNATDYQLTHLLENGHVIRNKYGQYGRWTPTRRHIKPAEEKGIARFEEEIVQGANKI